jgi:hypothetical protein
MYWSDPGMEIFISRLGWLDNVKDDLTQNDDN